MTGRSRVEQSPESVKTLRGQRNLEGGISKEYVATRDWQNVEGEETAGKALI